MFAAQDEIFFVDSGLTGISNTLGPAFLWHIAATSWHIMARNRFIWGFKAASPWAWKFFYVCRWVAYSSDPVI